MLCLQFFDTVGWAAGRGASETADATAAVASVKSRLVLPFWYWLTRVVPEKRPLNGCVCVISYVLNSRCINYLHPATVVRGSSETFCTHLSLDDKRGYCTV